MSPDSSYMVGAEGVERALRRVRAAVESAGTPAALVIITMPSRDATQRAPDRRFFGAREQPVAEMARQLGFVPINTLVGFLAWIQKSGRDPGALMLSQKDPHPSLLGHQILARTVAAQLKASGLLQSRE